MKRTTYAILAGLVALGAIGCTDVEKTEIQVPNSHSSEYYRNLREYKKSDHAICFGWYAGYTSDSSPSMGLHFTGLPDSMDIISLWSGIPSNNPEYVESSDFNERYMPNAYRELQQVREQKGTRFVMCRICRIEGTGFEKNDAGIEAYALYLARCVLRNNLDGLDLDYEPEGDWLQGENFTKFIQVLGRFFGPKSGTDKLLIVDFYNQVPPAETEPYVDYFVRQCYSTTSAASLQSKFDQLSSWCPPKSSSPRSRWAGTGKTAAWPSPRRTATPSTRGATPSTRSSAWPAGTPSRDARAASAATTSSMSTTPRVRPMPRWATSSRSRFPTTRFAAASRNRIPQTNNPS